jgi:hypothetical protein
VRAAVCAMERKRGVGSEMAKSGRGAGSGSRGDNSRLLVFQLQEERARGGEEKLERGGMEVRGDVEVGGGDLPI